MFFLLGSVIFRNHTAVETGFAFVKRSHENSVHAVKALLQPLYYFIRKYYFFLWYYQLDFPYYFSQNKLLLSYWQIIVVYFSIVSSYRVHPENFQVFYFSFYYNISVTTKNILHEACYKLTSTIFEI